MLLVGLIIMFSALLIGCGGKKEKQVLNLYSWADNFNPTVIADFEQKYNCKVNYDVFANNEEMLAKIQAGGSQYDLIQPSDYMVQTMIKLNLLEELRKDNLPNLKNMTTYFKTPPYDPQGKYSVVYAWGVTGIAYNKKYVKQTPESWSSLWNSEYKGKVIMLNDSREVIGMGLKKNGYSNSSKNDAEIEMAVNDLKRATPNVLAFDTDTIKQKFIAQLKQKETAKLQAVSNIKQTLFPANSLQERYDNFIPMFKKYGKNLIATLIEMQEGIESAFIILTEDKNEII